MRSLLGWLETGFSPSPRRSISRMWYHAHQSAAEFHGKNYRCCDGAQMLQLNQHTHTVNPQTRSLDFRPWLKRTLDFCGVELHGKNIGVATEPKCCNLTNIPMRASLNQPPWIIYTYTCVLCVCIYVYIYIYIYAYVCVYIYIYIIIIAQDYDC